MSKNQSRTFLLVLTALFVACEVVMTRFLSPMVGGIVRIDTGVLPIAMLGIIAGPWVAGVGYAIGDIIGMLLWPSGAYFPGFTFTLFLTGVLFGFFLYKKEKIKIKDVILPSLIVVLFCNLVLDTIWLTILMNQGFIALLPARLIKVLIAFLLQIIFIPLVWNTIFAKNPSIKRVRGTGNR